MSTLLDLDPRLVTEAILNFVEPGNWNFDQSLSDGSATIDVLEKEGILAILSHCYYENKNAYTKDLSNKPYPDSLYISEDQDLLIEYYDIFEKKENKISLLI